MKDGGRRQSMKGWWKMKKSGGKGWKDGEKREKRVGKDFKNVKQKVFESEHRKR